MKYRWIVFLRYHIHYVGKYGSWKTDCEFKVRDRIFLHRRKNETYAFYRFLVHLITVRVLGIIILESFIFLLRSVLAAAEVKVA